MAHDEEQEWHSAVKQKPVDSLKFTHIWVVAPRLERLAFEGRVQANVAGYTVRRYSKYSMRFVYTCPAVHAVKAKAVLVY